MVSWTHTFTPTFFVENVVTVSLINWQYSLNQPSAQQNISAQFGTPNPFKCQRRALHQQCGLPERAVPRHRAAQPVHQGIQRRTELLAGIAGNTRSNSAGGTGRRSWTRCPTRPSSPILSYASNATAHLQSVHRNGIRHAGADRRQRRQFLPGHRRFVRAAAASAELQHEGQGPRRRTFRTTGRSAAT